MVLNNRQASTFRVMIISKIVRWGQRELSNLLIYALNTRRYYSKGGCQTINKTRRYDE